jgi:hypothetical protein
MSGQMVPFLDQPVMLHSNRDPGTCTMTPAQCAFKTSYWVFWYEADHRYALPTVAFFLVAIIFFTISRAVSYATPQRVKRKSIWSRLVAALRFLSYKSWQIRGWNSHSLGMYLLAAAGAVFFLGELSPGTLRSSTCAVSCRVSILTRLNSAMTLGPRPYYWPNTKEISYGSSPPIATRAGFLALACMPFLM